MTKRHYDNTCYCQEKNRDESCCFNNGKICNHDNEEKEVTLNKEQSMQLRFCYFYANFMTTILTIGGTIITTLIIFRLIVLHRVF